MPKWAMVDACPAKWGARAFHAMRLIATHLPHAEERRRATRSSAWKTSRLILIGERAHTVFGASESSDGCLAYWGNDATDTTCQLPIASWRMSAINPLPIAHSLFFRMVLAVNLTARPFPRLYSRKYR